jgi:hypothetical protein
VATDTFAKAAASLVDRYSGTRAPSWSARSTSARATDVTHARSCSTNSGGTPIQPRDTLSSFQESSNLEMHTLLACKLPNSVLPFFELCAMSSHVYKPE